MLPENKLSTEPIFSSFLVPNRKDLLVDYEKGGVAVQNPSEGLDVYLWEAFYEDKWITLKNDVETVRWLNIENVTELSLSFDFNMNPTVVYVTGGSTYLNWYDSSVQQLVTTNFGTSVQSPQVSLDGNRLILSNSSDIIFAYVRNSAVYYRQQRDRYGIEYYVGNITEGVTLLQIGMNIKCRFQFKIY